MSTVYFTHGISKGSTVFKYYIYPPAANSATVIVSLTSIYASQ